mmetsp:Transcript_14486/g.33288  ORF Transcript_14486/g.33288 Transcript_14486/m.33288 type:complete len:350 (-) Transcript_14486:31-1080(-)
MPPPRSVTCTMCGQQFFKASLPFHVKQCRLKTEAIPISCPGCQKEFPRGELRSHMSRCVRLKTAPTPRNKPSSARGLEVLKSDDCHYTTRRIDGQAFVHPTDFVDQYDQHDMLSTTADGRMACRYCNRKFSIDRVSVHMKICEKTQRGQRKRGTFNSAKQRLTGVSEVRTMRNKLGSSKMRESYRSIEKNLPSAKPSDRTYTPWRQKCKQLRDGLRAARSFQLERHLSRPLTSACSANIGCPHCHRIFPESQARLHMSTCLKGKASARDNLRSNTTPRLKYDSPRDRISPSLSRHHTSFVQASARATSKSPSSRDNYYKLQSVAKRVPFGIGGLAQTNATSRDNPLIAR